MAETLCLTATNLAVLLLAFELLPNGIRKKGLATALAALTATIFRSRVLRSHSRGLFHPRLVPLCGTCCPEMPLPDWLALRKQSKPI